MTDTLQDRLHGLAEEAGRPTDPALARDLWRRGRRYHRLRRAGTAVVTGALVALLAVGVLGVQRASVPTEPVPADAPAGLPDRIYEPSRWLPGTEDAGPLGRLVAVIPDVERGAWSGSTRAPVGISAMTGEYRFLDLPDQVAPDLGVSMALSPDDRWLAYWTTGTPSGTPNTLEPEPITGVALYDAATGEVQRHEVETEHGLSAWELSWLDADTLSVGIAQYLGGGGEGASRLQQELLWETSDLQLHPDDRSAVERRRDGWGREGTVVSPSGARVAGLANGGSTTPAPVEVFELDDATARRGSPAEVPASKKTYGVLGWTDDRHVVAVRVLGDRSYPEALKQDVATGESDSLVRLPEANAFELLWAADLWRAPVVPAEEPPSPVDPLLYAGLAAGLLVVLAAGIALLLWSRRVRR